MIAIRTIFNLMLGKRQKSLKLKEIKAITEILFKQIYKKIENL